MSTESPTTPKIRRTRRWITLVVLAYAMFANLAAALIWTLLAHPDANDSGIFTYTTAILLVLVTFTMDAPKKWETRTGKLRLSAASKSDLERYFAGVQGAHRVTLDDEAIIPGYGLPAAAPKDTYVPDANGVYRNPRNPADFIVPKHIANAIVPKHIATVLGEKALAEMRRAEQEARK